MGFSGLDHEVYRAVIDARQFSPKELFEVVAVAEDPNVKVAPLGYCFYTAVRRTCPQHLKVEKADPFLVEGVWPRIVRYLSPRDIRSLLHVCRSWRCEADRTLLWQSICAPNTEMSAEGFFSWHKGQEQMVLAMAARIQRDPYREYHPSRGRCVQLYELICTSEAALAQFQEGFSGPAGEFAPGLEVADVPKALGQFLAGIHRRCGGNRELWAEHGYSEGRIEFYLQYGIPVVGDTSFRDAVVPLLERKDVEANELLADQVRRLGHAHFRVGGAALRTHWLAQLSDAELVALVKRRPDMFAMNSIVGTLIERFRTGEGRDLFGALPSLIAEVQKPPGTEGGISLAWVSDAMDEMTRLFEEVLSREGELTSKEAIQLAKLSGWILSKDTNHWLKLFRGARLAHPSDCPILAYRALEMGLDSDSEEMVRVRAWLYVSRALDVPRAVADYVRTLQDSVLDTEQLSQWLLGQAHLAPQLDNSRAFLQACKQDGRISKDVADKLLALVGE